MMATMAVIIINNKCHRYCHSINWHLHRVSDVPDATVGTLKILTLNLQNNPATQILLSSPLYG